MSNEPLQPLPPLPSQYDEQPKEYQEPRRPPTPELQNKIAEVNSLRQQGYSNDQIIQALQGKGYKSDEIFDVMSQPTPIKKEKPLLEQQEQPETTFKQELDSFKTDVGKLIKEGVEVVKTAINAKDDSGIKQEFEKLKAEIIKPLAPIPETLRNIEKILHKSKLTTEAHYDVLLETKKLTKDLSGAKEIYDKILAETKERKNHLKNIDDKFYRIENILGTNIKSESKLKEKELEIKKLTGAKKERDKVNQDKIKQEQQKKADEEKKKELQSYESMFNEFLKFKNTTLEEMQKQIIDKPKRAGGFTTELKNFAKPKIDDSKFQSYWKGMSEYYKKTIQDSKLLEQKSANAIPNANKKEQIVSKKTAK